MSNNEHLGDIEVWSVSIDPITFDLRLTRDSIGSVIIIKGNASVEEARKSASAYIAGTFTGNSRYHIPKGIKDENG